MQAADVECYAIVGNLRVTDRSESSGDRFHVIVAITEEVEVAGRPERIRHPRHKEHRTLQNKLVAMPGHAQPIEQTLEGKTCQHYLKIRPFSARPVKQLSPY